MPLKLISYENVKKNTNSNTVYYVLSGKNGNENRYDLLGFFDGNYFSARNKFNPHENSAFIFTDVPLAVSGGERGTRKRKQRI